MVQHLISTILREMEGGVGRKRGRREWVGGVPPAVFLITEQSGADSHREQEKLNNLTLKAPSKWLREANYEVKVKKEQEVDPGMTEN